jgi:PAS domain S-box-containing protein
MTPASYPNPLHSSEAQARAVTQLLLEALPLGALMIDPQGRIVALNLQAETLLGWGALALEGQSAHEMLQCRVEDVAPDVDCPISGVLGGESAAVSGSMRIRCRDGSLKPVEYRCVSYPTGRGVGALLAFRDLTRQWELEKELRRLASIAEESPIAIVELNEDANLVHANPAMMSLVERFGFSSAARPAILPADIENLTAECLRTQSEIGGVEVNAGKNYYEWKLVPVTRERLVRGYGTDLTARKRAEIELLKAKANAEAANQAKSEFLANTSHEIRSPIHIVLGAADLLAQSDLNDTQRKYVKTLRSAAMSLMTVVNDILDMAALEAGRVQIELTRFDFRVFMKETTAAFIRQAERKGLRLHVAIGAKVPARIRCDRMRLGQLLHNLLSNAIKFTERGEIVVEVDRDTIAACPFESTEKSAKGFPRGNVSYLFFTVRDTGIGIAREHQEVIFDRFSQADGSSHRCYEGTGLGLAISKHLVELMGGTIGVESEPEKGSRFWFSLPIPKEVEEQSNCGLSANS